MRGSREDDVGLVIVDEASELVDHADVGLLVIKLHLDVKVETVDRQLAERTRALEVLVVGSEDIEHLLSKLLALLDSRDGVVAGGCHLATNGEVDFLAERLACLDIVFDEAAGGEQLSRLLVGTGVDGGSTVGAEVGSRVAVAVLRRVVHKSEGDIVDAGGLAVLAQGVDVTGIVVGLPLNEEVSRLV